MAFTKVAEAREVPPGTVIEVMHNSRPFAVCNVDGDVRATSGVCPHSGGPLGHGTLHGDNLTCPFHAWEFDSRTGVCDFNPSLRIATYAVRVAGGEILVDFPNMDFPGA